MIYAVMERTGNFSHTLAEFDDYSEAESFMIDLASTDVFEEYSDDVTGAEWVEAVENALSYYSIDKWSTA